MLPWNCNKGIIAIDEKMFILDFKGEPHEIKLHQQGGELTLSTTPLKSIPDQIEYITKSYQKELICLSSSLQNQIYSVQLNSDLVSKGSEYPIITYKLPADDNHHAYWSIVLPLNRGQFLVVQALLPTEYSNERLKNRVLLLQRGRKPRFTNLPTETSGNSSPERTPLIWERQIAEIVTNGLVIKKGGLQNTWITLLMTMNGLIFFVAVTPTSKTIVLHCATLCRLSLHGCTAIGDKAIIFYGKFRHLIKLQF